MRKALLIGSILTPFLCNAQGFNRRYDPHEQGQPQTALGIEKGIDGYVVFSVTGQVDSLGPDSFFYHHSVALTSLTAAGEVQWETVNWREQHTATPGWANCCDTVPGGGFVVGGASEDTTGVDEVYLMRFNAQGDTLWTKVFGGLGQYWIGRQVKRTADGGFLIVGDTDAAGVVNGFALKTDSVGNEQWRRTYGSSGLSDYIVAVGQPDQYDYYFGGEYHQTQNDFDLWVMRTDSSGTVKWQKKWGSTYDEPNAHLIATEDGHAVVAASWGQGADFSNTRPYLAKLDSADGSLLWEHQFGGPPTGNAFFAVKERPDHGLIACGAANITSYEVGLLARTTSEGDSLWMRTYTYDDSLTSNIRGRFYDVLPTDDGGFIAAGVSYPVPGVYTQDTWVVKVDSFGCILPGCQLLDQITEQVTNLPAAVTVYPNPARATATLHIALPAKHTGEELQLTVVSTQGQRVAMHAVTIGDNTVDVTGYSAGLYYLHLSAGTTWLGGTKLVVE